MAGSNQWNNVAKLPRLAILMEEAYSSCPENVVRLQEAIPHFEIACSRQEGIKSCK
jgi:hypothetical protein